MDPIYKPLVEYLTENGIYAFFQQEQQLVVSKSFPHLPSTNTFWVTNCDGIWYLSTWLPVAYRVPKEADIRTLCKTVLESSETAMYRIDQDCVNKCGLAELSEEATEALFARDFGRAAW